MADNAAITISMQANEALLAQSVSRGISKGLSSVMQGGGLDSRGLESAFGRMTAGAKQFETALDRANQRTILFGASASVLYNAAKALQNIASATLDVEKNMVALNSVFRLTDQQLGQFQKTMFSIGQETSQSFDKVAEAAQELARQGLSVGETAKRTRDAMILTRLAAIDTVTAVNTLTAAINGFQKEGLDSATVVNKLANVDAAFAVSAKDLSEALVRVGSAAQDANVSFDQLIALVTAAKQTTGRDGAVISQALNTIFTRVNRKDTQEALEGLGVQMRDLATNKALPTLQVLSNFSKVYDQLTGSTRTWAAELVGGVRNLNTLKAVLSDLSKENSVYGQVLDTLGDKTSAAYRRNQELNQSLEATYTRFKEANNQALSNVGNVGFAAPVKTVLNAATNNVFLDAFRDANGQAETESGKVAEVFLKGFGNAIIFGLGPILFKGLSSIFLQTAGNIAKSVILASGLTQEQEAQAAIEQRINTLYKSGNEALLNQLATTKSLVAQAEILATAFARADATAIAGQSARGALARTVYQSGYRPRAADGYLPATAAESAAIRGGVGGAPASARPVTLAGFNFGGGVTGPLVANSSEFIVPNMAGGGSAIYNRDMIRRSGLPPGAIPVAAGGYVPNAASGFDYGSLRQGSGAPVSKAGISELNTLLDKLASAETRKGAEAFSGQIVNITQKFNEVSQSKVLDTIGQELNRFDQGLNKVAFSAKIVTDQSGKASPEAIAEYEARRAARQVGSSALASDLTPLYKQQGLISDAIEKESVATRLSLKDRLLSRFKSPIGQIGTSIGLTFAGGAIGEGQGGTTGGVVRGALGTGLTGAGFGLSVAGVPGAVIGGLGGAALGGLSKLSKSADEVAEQLDKTSKLLAQQNDSGFKFIRLQADAREALQQGNTKLVGILNKQSEEELVSLKRTNPKYAQFLLSNLNNPNATEQFSALATSNTTSDAKRSNLLNSVFAPSQGSALARALTFNSPVSDKQTADITESFSALLSGYSTKELAALSRLNKNSPQAAFESVASRNGIKPSEYQNSGLPFFQDSAVVQETIAKAIRSLIGTTGSVSGQLTSAQKEDYDTKQALRQLASDYESASKNVQIGAAGQQRINQASQQILLNQTPYSARELILQQGRFEKANIYEQSAAERNSVLLQGQSSLVDLVGKSGASSPIFRQAIGGLTSKDAVDSLIATLNTDEGKIKYAGTGGLNKQLLDSLTILSDNLKKVDVTEQENVFVSKELQKLTLADLNFQRSRAGGAVAYNRLALNAFESVNEARAQNLPPDEQLRRQRALSSIDIQRDYQRRLIPTAEEYYGRTLGLQSRNSQQDRLINASAVRNVLQRGGADSQALSGSEVQQALLGEAQVKGQRGQAGASFSGGLESVFKGLKQDMNDLSQLGAQVGQSLQQNLGNAFGDFITGAKSGKDAFKSFVTSVLADAARAFASQAVVQLIGSIVSSYAGSATGGTAGGGSSSTPTFNGSIGDSASSSFHYANGGQVPALLTGGEYVFSATEANRIGSNTLKAVNNGSMFASGGMVTGGSGVRDDVPMNLDPGAFVIKRSAVQKYGANYLNALAGGGKVQKRAFGGSIMPNTLASAGANYGFGPSTAYPSSTNGYRRFADGGATATMAATPQGSDNIIVPTPVYTTPTRGGSSSMGSVNVGVTVNNNGDSNSSSQSSNGGGVKDRQFADTLAVRVKAITLQTIIEHQRVGGILRPQSQLRPA